ncbi:MAG: hypothetical protein JO314_03495 [Acidobacteria bacterium]|nr:hypothetical protein [Acidobacteriota bacterium]
MRSVQVNTPKELMDRIAGLAHSVGVSVVDVGDITAIHDDGARDPRVEISFETSTPKAKTFIDKLLLSDFYDRQVVWFEVRERRSIVGKDAIHDVTYPWVIPSTDILEDLYQFSHLTWGLVGRVFLAACLLSYGLLNQNLLLMIAGMMFIPLLPVISSIGFGGWLGHWRLAMRATSVLVVTIILLFVGGLAIGAIGSPPVQYTDFPSILTGVLISVAVGVAAALAHTDDVGRRELIGLAATSQIAIVPAWLGLCLVVGMPPTMPASTVEKRLLSLVINVACVIAASLVTYIAVRATHPSLRILNDDK